MIIDRLKVINEPAVRWNQDSFNRYVDVYNELALTEYVYNKKAFKLLNTELNRIIQSINRSKENFEKEFQGIPPFIMPPFDELILKLEKCREINTSIDNADVETINICFFQYRSNKYWCLECNPPIFHSNYS